MPASGSPAPPPPNRDPDLTTGSAAIREFSGYQILERVSADDAAGTVTYRARQKSLGRMVRITVLPRAAASKPGYLSRFQRQVGVASRLKHDNVLSAFDAGSASGIPYVVFEELDGISLAAELERGPLRLPRVIDIGIDIARALEHFASQGLIHRNVRPSTIHLPEHAPAKLTGLGVAKVRVSNGAETWIDRDSESAACVSPESVRGARGIDIRSDIYALGCVLYHAATGRPPFQGATPAIVLALHATETPTDPRTLHEALPQGLLRVIDRCMRKDPDERYARPADVAHDLQLAKTGRPVDRGPGKPLWPDAEKSRKLPSILRRRPSR
jgi:serine/threonine-protein kinase